MSSVFFIHSLRFGVNGSSCLTPGGIDDAYLSRFGDAGYSKVYLISRSTTQFEKRGGSYRLLSNVDGKYLWPNVGYLFFFNALLYIRLLKGFDKKQDLFVINFPAVSAIFFLPFCALFKLPYVVEIASDSNQFRTKPLGSIIDFMNYTLGLFLIPRAKGALYVSDFLRAKWPVKHAEVLSNVIIHEVVNPKSLRVGSKRFRVVLVGAVSRRKGIDLLCSHFEEPPAGLRFDIYVVGPVLEPQLKNDLQLRSSESIRFFFPGVVSKDEVLRLLHSADVYLQLSRSEGLPRACLEAMSCGLPVLCSRLPGLEGIVDEENLHEIESSPYKPLSALLTNEDWYIRSSKSSVKMANRFLNSKLRQRRKAFYSAIRYGKV